MAGYSNWQGMVIGKWQGAWNMAGNGERGMAGNGKWQRMVNGEWQGNGKWQGKDNNWREMGSIFNKARLMSIETCKSCAGLSHMARQ